MSNECEYCLGSGYSDPDLKVICGVCGGKTEWYKSGKTGFLVVVSNHYDALKIEHGLAFVDVFKEFLPSQRFNQFACRRGHWKYARPATREDFILYEDIE